MASAAVFSSDRLRGKRIMRTLFFMPSIIPAIAIFIIISGLIDVNNGWITQVLIVGGNAALFLFLGVGYGHWLNATLNSVGGLALNELQFFTQPTGLMGAWKRYKAGDLGTAAPHATGSGYVNFLTEDEGERVAA